MELCRLHKGSRQELQKGSATRDANLNKPQKVHMLSWGCTRLWYVCPQNLGHMPHPVVKQISSMNHKLFSVSFSPVSSKNSPTGHNFGILLGIQVRIEPLNPFGALPEAKPTPRVILDRLPSHAMVGALGPQMYVEFWLKACNRAQNANDFVMRLGARYCLQVEAWYLAVPAAVRPADLGVVHSQDRSHGQNSLCICKKPRAL